MTTSEQTTNKIEGEPILKYPKITKGCLAFVGLVLVAVIAVDSRVFAAEPQQIALLPFKINAAKDLSFLRDGIFDMLTSRLSQEGMVEILDRNKTEAAMASVAGTEAVNEKTAREIGTRLEADFVLFGSLTVVGDSVSMDARMVDVSGQRPTMSFFDQSQDLGAVITKINLMAADINAKLFGRETVAQTTPPAAPAAAQPAQTQPAPAQATQGAQPDVHAHPEKLLESGAPGEDVQVMSGRAREIYQQFWRSPSFKHLINGLAVADVDGDQKTETVAVTPRSILIYRLEQDRFLKIAEIEESSTKYFIGVDAADINGNGIAEIFVTSLNNLKNQAVSMVFEYDGKNYQKIVENSSWFYRVSHYPAGGPILLGQKHRAGKPLSGAIFELAWQNGDYVAQNEIKPPGEISVLGLCLGDVLGNRQEVAVAYSQSDYLQVFEPTGKEIWTGDERHGGSMLYYAEPRKDLGDVENRLYFPLRTIVWQNKAGAQMVIAAYNQEMTGMKLEFRKFNKAHLEALSWDGLGLVADWKTRQVSGFIQDFAVGDFDNDGSPELVAAVIIKEGRVAFSEPKSAIIAYEIGS